MKSGDATRRYLGTIRTTSASTTEDSTTRRFVWNAANQVSRGLRSSGPTATLTTTSNAFVTFSASMDLSFVTGLPQTVTAQQSMAVKTSTAPSDANMAILLAGTDYKTGGFPFEAAGLATLSGAIIFSLAEGAYTASFRWAKAGGAGVTLTYDAINRGAYAPATQLTITGMF